MGSTQRHPITQIGRRSKIMASISNDFFIIFQLQKALSEKKSATRKQFSEGSFRIKVCRMTAPCYHNAHTGDTVTWNFLVVSVLGLSISLAFPQEIRIAQKAVHIDDNIYFLHKARKKVGAEPDPEP